MQFFAESVCWDEVVPGPAQHHEASHGFCMLVQRLKSTSITTKAWRHEHLNDTLFDETEMEQEESPEETDLFLHDEDDDDDAEDPEITGTVVAEAVVPCSTVTSQVEHAECFVYLRCAYGKHPPRP